MAQYHPFINFSMVCLKVLYLLLGPLLFILYSTPLSTVISNSSAKHHLFADDTQLFLSFSAASYSHNIGLLESAISSVSNLNLISFAFLILLSLIHLGFSWTDISGTESAWPFHFIVISYQFIFHFIHAILYLF